MANYEDLKPGCLVEVIDTPLYTDKRLAGLKGTVCDNHGRYTPISVKLFNRYNILNADGLYLIRPFDLKILNENDICIMEENHMKYITNYLNIAKVKLVDNVDARIFECANFEPDLKADDTCVVMTERYGLEVAKVLSIVDSNDIKTSDEVVSKVYTDRYHLRVENRKRAAEIKKKMEELAKQLQDIALYQMLAKDNPDMAKLLEEYKNISIN